MDNVHGFIDLTECEHEIIELPIFKRLQHIKQLSLVNWVFPGSEHTRYTHSLGVMHIADQMAINLGYDEEHRVLIRLAGLLHDLGHYPLSHEGETAYMQDYYAAKDCYEANYKQIEEKIEKLGKKPSLTRMPMEAPYHHEQITIRLIQHSKAIVEIIAKHYAPDKYPLVTIENICHIIVGNTEKKELSGLVQLMHSELDADRIDYSMRDAIFSGTAYGEAELGYLLRNLKKESLDGYEIIGLSPKAIAWADHFLINRFFSRQQVIYNKHVAILGMMVSTLIKEYRQGMGLIDLKSLFTRIDSHENNDVYCRFTDVAFWTSMYNYKQNSDDFYGNIANHLLNNTELGKVVNKSVFLGSKGEATKKKLMETAVYSEFKSKPEDRIFLLHDIAFTKQIPYESYVALKEEEKFSDESWKTKLFQESIVIIEDDHSMKLLVDCPESIVGHLYDKHLVMFREYQVL